MGLFRYIKVLIDINIQGNDRLVLCDNKVIHMQSTNMVKVRTAITRMQRITRLMIQIVFYFMKDGCRKFISVNGHYFDNE